MAIYIPNKNSNTEVNETNTEVLSGEALLNRIDTIASEIHKARKSGNTDLANALAAERAELLTQASKDNTLWY